MAEQHIQRVTSRAVWVGRGFTYFWVWPGSLVLVQGLPNPILANVLPAPQLDGIPHTP